MERLIVIYRGKTMWKGFCHPGDITLESTNYEDLKDKLLVMAEQDSKERMNADTDYEKVQVLKYLRLL
jgi:hypothetical protein